MFFVRGPLRRPRVNQHCTTVDRNQTGLSKPLDEHRPQKWVAIDWIDPCCGCARNVQEKMLDQPINLSVDQILAVHCVDRLGCRNAPPID